MLPLSASAPSPSAWRSIFAWVEGLGWPDAFLNAAMLLGGIGPVDPVRTTAGGWRRLWLLAGVVFLVVAGVMLAPVIHHVLQRFHLREEQQEASRGTDARPPRRHARYRFARLAGGV